MNSKMRRLLPIGFWALMLAGVSCVAYLAMVTAREKRFQAEESLRFDEVKSQRSLLRASVAKSVVPPDGSPLAKLAIPDLAVSLVVVEGVSKLDLSVGPGHIPGTALPGHSGNIGIAGHRDTVFRPLRAAHAGQIISLTTSDREDRYRIVSTAVVAPADTEVLKPNGRDMVTLVTCYPFDFVGAAPKRFIVHAERIP